jgi:hypothetical protein
MDSDKFTMGMLLALGFLIYLIKNALADAKDAPDPVTKVIAVLLVTALFSFMIWCFLTVNKPF